MLSQKVKHFVFEVVRESTFSYVPGQFITIHFEKDGKALKRSYSVANQPMNNNRIEFAAGYVDGGPATELLFGLQPGDTLNASGPFGRLILKEDTPKRYILVATSTGVTPYRAMLPSLRQRLHDNPELEVVILQGVQCADEILYVDEFQSFEKEYDTAQFYACLSRCQSSDLTNSNQRVGYVQHCFEALAVNPETDVIYLCGNPGMIDDAFAWLKEKGFVTQQIIREKYISR
jgi:ferredoxin-NADP reductase